MSSIGWRWPGWEGIPHNKRRQLTQLNRSMVTSGVNRRCSSERQATLGEQLKLGGRKLDVAVSSIAVSPKLATASRRSSAIWTHLLFAPRWVEESRLCAVGIRQRRSSHRWSAERSYPRSRGGLHPNSRGAV